MMNVESSRHYGPKIICRQILYYLVSFSLIGLLLAAIINTLFKYNTWPIYTEILVVPQNEAKFSAITMCPLSNGYKLHVLQVSILKYQSTTAFENAYICCLQLIRKFLYVLLAKWNFLSQKLQLQNKFELDQ